ncbi:tRNA threonylcarbamoyladenosine biosynthesis protein TsaE [Planctopirus ephydatiae]|uniref:tRNA threonylcarbamoyladenosine biosynthesis protein TsaE n=1 Tax=Planctopirus ephydatiae TaxID=2528019 RepID=A0A518GM39_9PLAN|nr:tRNA (adenosine(37)-N6)-threonylcarbamoyltransferase complex ATPase subunit type 1 TsaE [Planctopirus ephydatiae]QDV29690.1 tRNA threonylcarbamoyladenosine biosynthesis protein TsaE [Planctopirus ephydatiae]
MLEKQLNTFLANELETLKAGRFLGMSCQEPLIVLLSGQLGAGKTTLTRGIVEGLGGVIDDVSSPTFTLIHEYQARLSVYHLDTYRLKTSAEFFELGVDELLESEAVVLIEWPELVSEYLPADRLEIEIFHQPENTRELTAQATGPTACRVLEKWRELLRDP